jgi:hypothetical protein
VQVVVVVAVTVSLVGASVVEPESVVTVFVPLKVVVKKDSVVINVWVDE